MSKVFFFFFRESVAYQKTQQGLSEYSTIKGGFGRKDKVGPTAEGE